MENESDADEDVRSTPGHDNRSFTTDDIQVQEEAKDAVSIDAENLRVHYRSNSITGDVTQQQDTIEPLETTEDEQSPYEEVAANVSNKDDPTIAALTFRSWFLGIAFTAILSFVNQFFWYRTSPLVIGVLVAQLLSHLAGVFLAKVLPKKRFRVFRWSFTLNPGPFTVKEHCIITTMASTGCVSSFVARGLHGTRACRLSRVLPMPSTY